MPKKYEIGQVVGGVTIVGAVPDEKYNKYLLKCNTCGAEFVEYASAVRKHTNGCFGCKCKKNREKTYIDEIGKTYSNLKIIEYDEAATEKDKNRHTYVKCQCLKCNGTTSIPLARIKSGGAKECAACAQKNLEAGREYVKSESVFNTRISSIRKTSKNKNNTSGHNGVSRCKNGKYRAYINFQRKQYYLGMYDSPEEARAIRLEAENKIYGGFLNWYANTFPEKWELINKKKNNSIGR